MFWENAKVFGVSFADILVVLGLLGLALVLAGVTVIVRLVLDVIFS